MAPATVPEIQRTNLMSVALQLKTYGINDLVHFHFMDAPPRQALIDAITDLYVLGALDRNGKVTALGQKMARFPLDPPLSKLLITSADLGCSEEILTIVSVLSAQYNNVFFRPRKRRREADLQKTMFDCAEGDLCTLLAVYQKWEDAGRSPSWCQLNFVQAKTMASARQVREQLHDMMTQRLIRLESCNGDVEKVRQAICAGMILNVAVKSALGNNYSLIMKGQSAVLHPSSNQFQARPQWVVYSELIHTTNKFMRNITVVDPRWLIDHFCKLLQQNASGALALHEPASANGAVKPDASIIADLEDRVRRTLAQHLVWYDSTGRLRLLGIV
ncbi:Dhx8 protein [Aphelenchoides avenae]|nr:Dhx8 protein [Aphelenchus avenae]